MKRAQTGMFDPPDLFDESDSPGLNGPGESIDKKELIISDLSESAIMVQKPRPLTEREKRTQIANIASLIRASRQ